MIECKGISFSYGKEEYLKDLNIEFKNGEIVAILGKNGSGKSTLLRLISGSLKPSSGERFVDGESVDSIRGVRLAKKLSYFLQGREIPDMTVRELVLLGRYPYNTGGFSHSEDDEDAAAVAIKRLGIEPFADRMLPSLSYGERQKAYLAMHIASGTDNCLFDEPTSYMDSEGAFEVARLLSELRADGKCIVAVLHDIPLALKLSDKIAVMKEGRIEGVFTPGDAVNNSILEKTLGVRVREISVDGEMQYAVLPSNVNKYSQI